MKTTLTPQETAEIHARVMEQIQARADARAELIASLRLKKLEIYRLLGFLDSYTTPHRTSMRAIVRSALVPLKEYILRGRDNATCTLCGARGENRYDVHHIVPISSDWTRVADPYNLLTLCLRCHHDRAHAGHWRTVDAALQVELQRIATDRECVHGTPHDIVSKVQERLGIFGQKLERE